LIIIGILSSIGYSERFCRTFLLILHIYALKSSVTNELSNLSISKVPIILGIIIVTTLLLLTTIANAQQPINNQPAVMGNKTFQSTTDNFRVQVPSGWVIHDVKNTGVTLLEELLKGYGILAQLCPQEQQQQIAPDAGGSNTLSSSCQGSQVGEDVIQIIRYPNLGARLGIAPGDVIRDYNNTANTILAYEIQSLQEVGYRDIQIVNNTYTTINADISKAAAAINENNNDDNNGDNNANPLPPIAKVPAKLVEMTYRTDSAPNEIKTGYYLLTATNVTPRNLGMITGYSLFYESGNSSSDTATSPETSASGSSSSLASSPSTTTPLPAAIRQVFDSFELIAAPAQPLTVEITSSDTEDVAPASFEFEADVTGGMEPHTISWDFDDGSGESDDDDETPDHTFDQAGNYTVTATVTDSSGRTVSDSILITVEPPPPLTRVNIISNDTEDVAPASFEFEANVTGGIEPYTYSWDFGDGSEESDDDETIDHTFDQAGTYNVDLTVTDSSGRTVSDSILITVEPPPPLTRVNIISNDTEDVAPASFEFRARVVGGIEPYTYSWDFGDGSGGSNERIVVHTFDQAGTYVVAVIVTDSSGRTVSDSILIVVR
jgi:PKD repeat protein